MAAAAILNWLRLHLNDPPRRPIAQYHRRVAQRLRFYAAVYMMLAASFLQTAVSEASANNATYVNHIIGLVLWMAGMSLLLLSVVLPRYQAAARFAAHLAQMAFEALL